MNYEEFKTETFAIAGPDTDVSIFINEHFHYGNDADSVEVSITYHNPTRANGFGYVATEEHFGADRYQECLDELKSLLREV